MTFRAASSTFGNYRVGPRISDTEMVAEFRLLDVGRAATLRLQQEPGLCPADVARLRRDARRGDRARIKLIESNLRLVLSVARKVWVPDGLEFDDMVQGGNIGLIRAVDLFDVGRGFKFSTYATNWIQAGMQRESGQPSTVHVPENVRLSTTAKRGRGDNDLDSRERDAHRFTNVDSIDAPRGVGDESVVWADVLSDGDDVAAGVVALIEREELAATVRDVLDGPGFDDVDRAIVRGLYLQADGPGRQVDVAARLGREKSTISVRHRKVIAKLRDDAAMVAASG